MKKTPDIPTPPEHLSKAMQAWWKELTAQYDFESHHLRILEAACSAWDRMTQAREILDEQGLTYQDKFGNPRAAPEIAIERDSRLAFARLLRELALDVEPPPESPRPPRHGGQRH
jgi:P27 family predicted phage terminase small subunit